jgi:hypothetical protein
LKTKGYEIKGYEMLLKNERLDLEDLLEDYIYDSYRAWMSAPTEVRRREPNLTVTAMLDYVLQHGRCPDGLKFATRRKQQSVVRSVLTSSVRGGRLGTSFGLGEHGRETRCYEPLWCPLCGDVYPDGSVRCVRCERLRAELVDAWQGEGNSSRVSFEKWVRDMADNPRGTLQEAAQKWLGRRRAGRGQS